MGSLLENAEFDGQNSLITPVASPNAQTNTQTWLVVLSGVAVLKDVGRHRVHDHHQSRRNRANQLCDRQLRAPQPPARSQPFLQVEQWTPYMAVGSIFDETQSTDAGFDINTWRPNPFQSYTDSTTGLEFNQIFTGMQVDITARQTDTMIFRLPYNFTLIARIVYVALPF